MDKQYVVYTLYNEQDERVYVGMTGNWRNRLTEHKTSGRDFDPTKTTFEYFTDREEAAARERQQIKEHTPPQNSVLYEGVTKRVTLLLLPSEDARLVAEAKRQGVSIGHLVRALIAIGLADMERDDAIDFDNVVIPF